MQQHRVKNIRVDYYFCNSYSTGLTKSLLSTLPHSIIYVELVQVFVRTNIFVTCYISISKLKTYYFLSSGRQTILRVPISIALIKLKRDYRKIETFENTLLDAQKFTIVKLFLREVQI